MCTNQSTVYSDLIKISKKKKTKEKEKKEKERKKDKKIEEKC